MSGLALRNRGFRPPVLIERPALFIPKQATQAQLRNTEAQNEQLRREVEELRQAQGSDGAKGTWPTKARPSLAVLLTGGLVGYPGVVAEIQHISSRLVQLEANMAGSSDSLTPPAGPPAVRAGRCPWHPLRPGLDGSSWALPAAEGLARSDAVCGCCLGPSEHGKK